MPEAVAITLDNGQRFGDWSGIELQLGLDSYSALSLSGPFEHEREEVRRAFQPLLFPQVSVTIGDQLMMTGRVKDVSPTVDAGSATLAVTVYSLAYDLTEVCPPPELLPLAFDGLDLRQIAQRLVTPTLGILPVFESTAVRLGLPGAVFAQVRCEPDGVIHPFLVELALQRGLVLSDLPGGDLVFRSEAPRGDPVARLEGQPLGRVSVAFAPGSWFSRITGRASQKSGRSGSRYSQRNPLYRGSNPRDFTASVGDTESADVPKAVSAMMGRMVASVVSYAVEDLPGWRDPEGRLWRPNSTVTLVAPEAMVYRETELLIRAVSFRQTADSETATLHLVLPGTFGGELPTEFPWDL
jgi:prophage tail gpP-like protein